MVGELVGGGVLRLTAVGLRPGGTYAFRVRARNAAGAADWSGESESVRTRERKRCPGLFFLGPAEPVCPRIPTPQFCARGTAKGRPFLVGMPDESALRNTRAGSTLRARNAAGAGG